EDVPGTGKTTLAQALAAALGGSFSRVQFTADLLPSDIVGVSVFDQATSEFRFQSGPIFAHVVLADEINRTPPKTQSALLEAMNEHQVSIDGVVRTLPEPFLVIATQNPLEHHGTFPLPESQIDRFLMRLAMGYPDLESERLLLRQAGKAARSSVLVTSPEELVRLQREAMDVALHPDLEDYILTIIRATREHPGAALGVSPRGSQALVRAAKARAFLLGRRFVQPDDVQAVADPVLSHRIVPAESLAPGAVSGEGSAVLRSILASVAPPT
ncbi:MAG: MoxR family ATPase, partial [Deltaproteobacteria bacterium]|nr:MoxR family ATPase [Deltaproteobacteria bacterium]